jgi:hypothetical protein
MTGYRSVALVAALALAVHVPAAWAQDLGSRNSVGVYAQMYNEIGSFADPDTDSRWVFSDNAFGAGATFQRVLGQGLLLGVDVSYARPSYERQNLDTDAVIASGSASILTALATGRFAYGGGGDLGFYLTGGLGTIAYNLEDVGEWNADFALRAGTGLEYRFDPSKTIFLEWGRLWGYHEKEGVSGGRATHSVLKLGARFGL